MSEVVSNFAIVRAYWDLCKPRVIALMLVTVAVGMLMASPGPIPLPLFGFALLGIALSGGAGAVINHFLEREIDAKMHRTRRRPLPSGVVQPLHAIVYAFTLLLLGMFLLTTFVNPLTAVLTLSTVVGYAVIYTAFLKHATPQNIVLGGLAGAMPPLLGWTAVTGQFDAFSLLLVLIIFVWTPPHFWALALYRYEEYAKANIPMLPVTHGIEYTKLNIVLYTALLFAVSLLPFVVNLSGLIYLLGATGLGMGFWWSSYRLWRSDDNQYALSTFRYSIIYLFSLFVVLLVDHYVPILT